ncbi:Uncharacterised protein [uncultured archaeon]|nr:Uncharacterised protein [uncultured archaeon]
MVNRNFGMMFVALMLALAGLSFASVNPKLQLVNYSISETPAQPGHSVNLTLVFKSMEWDNCAEQANVQLSLSYPLSLIGPDTHYLGDLCASDPDGKSTTSFILPVDSLAQTGTYQIMVSSSYQQRFAKFADSNTINVRVGGAPSFTASVASSKPVDIYPGDTAYITVVFQNNGGGRAESARVAFTASDGVEVKWAGQTQELGQVAARGSIAATFAIETAKNLDPGTYRLNAVLDYASEDKTNGSASFSFDLPLAKKADFAVADGSREMMSGDDVPITLTLTNTGHDEAKSLKARIKPIFPFSTDGTVRYVESLKPGESVALAYTIHVDKDATVGRQLLSMLIDYENLDGNKLSDSVEFSLPVNQKTLTDRLSELWYVWALAVVILIAGVFRRKAKKQSA